MLVIKSKKEKKNEENEPEDWPRIPYRGTVEIQDDRRRPRDAHASHIREG